MHTETGNAITIRFALPSAALQPFVTTYYLTEVKASAAEPVVEDYLHPEWPNLRLMATDWAQSAIGGGEMETAPAFAVTGPTSMPTRFRVSSGRSWGIGLMPLGWAKFFDAQAGDYADAFTDGNADDAFAALRPLARELSTARSFAEEVSLIERHLSELLDRDIVKAEQIAAINSAILDPDIATASELADRVGMTLRSLERLSRRAFGFPPKLLLRRQRFLRSLAQFMLDPSLKWLSTLDCQYHDQAHFVRDFKRFMGMSPSAYAKLDKPMLIAAAQARNAIAGEAVQGLHDPGQGQGGPD
ncbi:MAG: helix-turn-helix domain-containing protein [Pseudomonadota bacterium]|nr:helix-turn-helix domain-containing protein [Pseudomonadota bacterium]